MSLERLLTEIDECGRSYRRALAALRSGPRFARSEDELSLRRFKPLNLDEYFQEQTACLTAISRAVRHAIHHSTLDGALHGAIEVYVTGSVARLEYDSNTSDVDLFAMLPSREGQVGPVDKETKHFADLEARVIEGMTYEFSERNLGEADVALDGAPVLSSTKKGSERWLRRFYREADLIRKVGRDYEAAWAAFQRASLIFEAVRVWPDKRDTEADLSGRIDAAVYGICEDLRENDFPLVGYCLAQFIAKSGILAKAASVRFASNKTDKKKEVAKTILGRLWTVQLNLVTMHILYWYQRIIQDRQWRVDTILGNLRKPPLFMLLRAYSWHMDKIVGYGRKGQCLERVREILKDDTRAEEVVSWLKEIRSRVGKRGTDEHLPLWFRFLQLAKVCRGLRNDEIMTDDVLATLSAWNQELVTLLGLCSRITLCLSPPNNSGMGMYRQLHGLLETSIHGAMEATSRD